VKGQGARGKRQRAKSNWQKHEERGKDKGEEAIGKRQGAMCKR